MGLMIPSSRMPEAEIELSGLSKIGVVICRQNNEDLRIVCLFRVGSTSSLTISRSLSLSSSPYFLSSLSRAMDLNIL